MQTDFVQNEEHQKNGGKKNFRTVMIQKRCEGAFPEVAEGADGEGLQEFQNGPVRDVGEPREIAVVSETQNGYRHVPHHVFRGIGKGEKTQIRVERRGMPTPQSFFFGVDDA